MTKLTAQEEKEFDEFVKRMTEEFGSTGASWRYGRKIGKGGLSGEKRTKGKYFHTLKIGKLK